MKNSIFSVMIQQFFSRGRIATEVFKDNRNDFKFFIKTWGCRLYRNILYHSLYPCQLKFYVLNWNLAFKLAAGQTIRSIERYKKIWNCFIFEKRTLIQQITTIMINAINYTNTQEYHQDYRNGNAIKVSYGKFWMNPIRLI